MKQKLKEFSGINILRRNEKLQPSCCYLLSSESVSSCTYFETKRDIKRAHEMFNRHLSPIMRIIDYLFTPNGWMLVVTVHDEVEILEYIAKSKYLSSKIKTALKQRNISVIISECIRYAISGIARIINKYNKRHGALVTRNFSRFIFITVESASILMKKMKEEQIKLCSKNKRYRPSLQWFDMKGELREAGDVFLCGKNHGNAEISERTKGACVLITCITLHVLREIIELTFLLHSKPKTYTSTQIKPI